MKKTVVGIRLCAVLAAGCMGLALCNFSVFKDKKEISPEFVFTYAETQPEEYPSTRGAVKFADLVNQRTKGRIKINVVSGGKLGDESSIIEQLQFGGVDFARIPVMDMAKEVPKLNVLQLPGLYRDEDHMWKVLGGEIGREFMESLNGHGVVGLSWYDAGTRHFYNSMKPIECLEDLKGMRIRVPESDLMEGMIESLGATPVPMGYLQVYAALETRSIDGAENNLPSYEFENHFKVARYITLDGHSRVPELQLASQATWDKLNGEEQKIIMDCARESSVYQRKLWDEDEKEAEKRLLAKGCVITRLSPDEQLRFRISMLTVYQKYCSENSENIDMVNRISEVQ